MTTTKLISLGTMYVDLNCINFPFDKGLFANRETTGNEYKFELGGSALNFAKMAAILSLDTTFIGKIGNDMMGSVLTELLKKNAIRSDLIIDDSVQTNLAVHYIRNDGSSIMTSSGSANQALSYQEIKQKITKHKDAHFLYLGGCFKLKTLLPHLPEVAKLTQKKGMKVVLDHGRVNNQVTKEEIEIIKQLVKYTDIYLPSIDEFLTVWDAKTIAEGINHLKQYGWPCTIIKQGDLGAIGFCNNERIEIPAFAVTVINTVGAGDSFNAGFINAYSKKYDIKTCIRYACAIAAIKISAADTFFSSKIEDLAKT